MGFQTFICECVENYLDVAVMTVNFAGVDSPGKCSHNNIFYIVRIFIRRHIKQNGCVLLTNEHRETFTWT